MFALIPCPEELLPGNSPGKAFSDDTRYINQGYESSALSDGFWVGTTDAKLIKNSPTAATGVDEAAAIQALDTKLGAPPEFTLIGKRNTVSSSVLGPYKPNTRYSQGAEEKDLALHSHYETLRKLIERLHGGERGSYSASWYVYPVLQHPYAKGLDKWKYMAEAKVHKSSGGILVSPNEFPIEERHHVEVVGTEYIVEYYGLAGYHRLQYNPRRAKALITRRKNAGAGKTGAKFKYTAYECVYSISCEMSRYIFDEKLFRQFSTPWWASRGIETCCTSTLQMWNAIQALNSTSIIRKRIAKYLRMAHWHRKRYPYNFRVWLDEQLEKLGGAPKPEHRERYRTKPESRQNRIS